jgi:predicted Ser/Thr protein kinase
LHGRFAVVRALGKGAMASVWLATDGPRLVALKVLHPELRRRKKMVERLEHEGAILRELAHPGIAAALGFFEDDGFVSLAMEYVDGVTLERWLGERNLRNLPLSMEEVGAIFDSLLDPIEHAHQRGVLHRDLKPQNIMMVAGTERPKVLDFGIAKLLEGDLHDATTQGRRVGSPYYMSPEQTRGDPPDARSDIFALGSMLFEMITLRRAWLLNIRGERLAAFVDDQPDVRANAILEVSARICGGERPRASEYRVGLDSEVDRLLARALAVEAPERFLSIAELRAEARRVFFGDAGPTRVIEETPTLANDKTPVLAPTETVTLPARIRPARGRSVVVVGILAAGLAVIGVAFSFRRAPAPIEAPRPLELAQPRAVARAAEPIAEEPTPALDQPVRVAPKLVARPATKPVSRLEVLAETLADLKSSAADSARTIAFAEQLAQESRAIRDEAKRRRIQRIAESSALTGDLAGLEYALQELRREVEP